MGQTKKQLSSDTHSDSVSWSAHGLLERVFDQRKEELKVFG